MGDDQDSAASNTVSRNKQNPPSPRKKTKRQVSVGNANEDEVEQVFMAPSRAWPTTLQEMAQDSILALLRGNETLCLRIAENEHGVRDSLFDIYSFVANKHGLQQQRSAQRKTEAKVAMKRRKSVAQTRKYGIQGSPQKMGEQPVKDTEVDQGGEEEEDELLLLTSCDTSPALDFFFIMCAPTASRPLLDFQVQIAER
jgi:hypothetical protein